MSCRMMDTGGLGCWMQGCGGEGKDRWKVDGNTNGEVVS